MIRQTVWNQLVGASLFLAYFALLAVTALGGRAVPSQPAMATFGAGAPGMSGAEAHGRAATPRLAVVFDDWGYAWEAADDILALPVPITVAVIPNLPYSVAQARAASQLGREVILHLPMTPEDTSQGRDESMVGPRLETADIRTRVRDALDAVPGIIGVNNHMGSLASADERVMRAVLSEVRRRGLFFLDSHTSTRSVIPRVAESLRVPYAVNRVFLDGVKDPAYVRQQVEKAIRIAEREGSAVAIGHVRTATYDGVAAMLPEIARRGVRVVPLSDLVNRP